MSAYFTGGLRWLVVFGLLCAPAWAQVGGSIGGVVKDNSGGVIPGATVTITNLNTNVVRVLQTGSEGNYRAVNLQPAPYDVMVEVSGFGTVKRPVTVQVGTDVALDFALKVGDVVESLTVTGQASALNIEVSKSQPSSVVTDAQVSALPNLSRNFLVLAQLMPGAAPIPSGPLRADEVRRHRRPAQRLHHDHRRRDGGRCDMGLAGHQHDAGRGAGVQGVRHQFDAQYGSALNAVVNVVSKSGGDKYHGTGLLLRPRLRAERDERLCDNQAAVQPDAGRRHGRRTGAGGGDARISSVRSSISSINNAQITVVAGEQPVCVAAERHLSVHRDREDRRLQGRSPLLERQLARTSATPTTISSRRAAGR